MHLAIYPRETLMLTEKSAPQHSQQPNTKDSPSVPTGEQARPPEGVDMDSETSWVTPGWLQGKEGHMINAPIYTTCFSFILSFSFGAYHVACEILVLHQGPVK